MFHRVCLSLKDGFLHERSIIMKMRLLGGPLDGTVVETPAKSIEPEMVHFSESRRVHHYLWHEGEEFRYLSNDTIIDDRSVFDAWCEKQGIADPVKDVAWAAWSEALARF
jgi:hypothetical protein